MIAEPMHFSLSLDLVSWRVNLWAEQQRRPNEHVVERDKPLTLQQTSDEARDNEQPGAEPSHFVRKPVRVVYTPRRSRNG